MLWLCLIFWQVLFSLSSLFKKLFWEFLSHGLFRCIYFSVVRDFSFLFLDPISSLITSLLDLFRFTSFLKTLSVYSHVPQPLEGARVLGCWGCFQCVTCPPGWSPSECFILADFLYSGCVSCGRRVLSLYSNYGLSLSSLSVFVKCISRFCCLVYTHLGSLSSWWVWSFYYYLVFSWSLVIFFVLILFYQLLMFAWHIFFHSFIFSLLTSLNLKWVSCKLHIVGLSFF